MTIRRAHTMDEFFRSAVSATLGARSVPLVWLVISYSALIALLLSLVGALILFGDDNARVQRLVEERIEDEKNARMTNDRNIATKLFDHPMHRYATRLLSDQLQREPHNTAQFSRGKKE